MESMNFYPIILGTVTRNSRFSINILLTMPIQLVCSGETHNFKWKIFSFVIWANEREEVSISIFCIWKKDTF